MKTIPTANDNDNITEWNVDISEYDGRGKFRAVCRELGYEVTDRDPEHTICHRLQLAGCKDGPVYFWRNGQKSMTFRSLIWGARHRIQEGDKSGLRLVKRREAPTVEPKATERPMNAQNTVRGYS